MSESMPSRSWFTYRYALPGFVFIILLTVINIEPLEFYLKPYVSNLGVNVAVALLVFLAGPSLGFIIAQIWYSLFEIFRDRWDGRWRNELIGMGKAREESFTTDADYIFYKDNEFLGTRLLDYLTRRWDLYHTLWSTIIAFVLAYLFGIAIRILILGWSPNLTWPDISSFWIRFHIAVFVLSSTAVVFFILGARRIHREHEDMVLKLIRLRLGTKEDWSKLFVA